MIKLVVCNQKGGVAKTTTTNTLAHFLASRGKRVLVFDTDQQGNLGDAVGAKPQHDLHAFLIEGTAFEETTVRVWERDGQPGVIDMVCSNRRTQETEQILMARMGREFTFCNVLDTLDLQYDVVLFDTAPSFTLLQTCAIVYAKQMLIPLQLDLLSLNGVNATIQTAKTLNMIFKTDVKAIAFLPTLVQKHLQMTRLIRTNLERLAQELNIPILQDTRQDAIVGKALKARQFLPDFAPDSRINEDYQTAFGQLLNVLEGAKPGEQAGTVEGAAAA